MNDFELKAIGIGLNVRDNLVRNGVQRNVAEEFGIVAQESAKSMGKIVAEKYQKEIDYVMNRLKESEQRNEIGNKIISDMRSEINKLRNELTELKNGK